ncbi:MAG: virulence RhuM family protein [Myxococcales bacterium]|nr:virulence RhuM family protein [Myxococcales bacterium]
MGPHPGKREVDRDPVRFKIVRFIGPYITAYLELAELQAMNRKPMYMADWITKLDDFLTLSDRDILRHTGRISHDEAAAKAELEYHRFASARAALPAPVEQHFDDAVRNVKQLDTARRASKPKLPPASSRKKR